MEQQTINKFQVLIVEDEEFLCKLLEKKLTLAGITAFCAFDGESGLQVAREKQPGIILLDLVLSDINGFEVLRRLKEEGTTKQIPVIVISNLRESKDVERAMQTGAVFYIVKAEYSPQQIVDKVREFLPGRG